ncbi:MAG: inorganic phosphate transporter [Candidatus Neomarinimicrobiota bacterium]
MLTLIFLSSGLFFGWSLGANDGAHTWGTAVSTRMVRFRTAALIASIFIILGAVISGEGASDTLGKLGSVNEIAGAFMVVLSAAFTVFAMTRAHLPVSTSQAIVGSIIGWNFFAGMLTDFTVLGKIVASWITSLILAGIFAAILFLLMKKWLATLKISIFRMDTLTRIGLIVLGALGSYALGANNIANVMGVFVPISPFKSLKFGIFELTSTELLFLLGGIAIAVGIFTYSKRVMMTVGQKVTRLTPQTALVVIMATAVVQLLFASQSLHNFLINNGLPALPLVPVSSSQLVIGAILGIGLSGRERRNINLKILGRIASGWIMTPIIAAIVTFICLFILQNVFDQRVYRRVGYEINEVVADRLARQNIEIDVVELEGSYRNIYQMHKVLKKYNFDKATIAKISEIGEVDVFSITNTARFQRKVARWFTAAEIQSIRRMENQTFQHRWELLNALQRVDRVWRAKKDEPESAREARERKLEYIFNYFRVIQ